MKNSVWDKYAKVLVDYSTDVQKGDLVIIRAESIHAKDLVKAVYKRVLEKGGNPILRTAVGDLAEIYIKHASDEQLEYIDEMSKLEVEKANVMIFIGAPATAIIYLVMCLLSGFPDGTSDKEPTC